MYESIGIDTDVVRTVEEKDRKNFSSGDLILSMEDKRRLESMALLKLDKISGHWSVTSSEELQREFHDYPTKL